MARKGSARTDAADSEASDGNLDLFGPVRRQVDAQSDDDAPDADSNDWQSERDALMARLTQVENERDELLATAAGQKTAERAVKARRSQLEADLEEALAALHREVQVHDETRRALSEMERLKADVERDLEAALEGALELEGELHQLRSDLAKLRSERARWAEESRTRGSQRSPAATFRGPQAEVSGALVRAVSLVQNALNLIAGEADADDEPRRVAETPSGTPLITTAGSDDPPLSDLEGAADSADLFRGEDRQPEAGSTGSRSSPGPPAFDLEPLRDTDRPALERLEPLLTACPTFESARLTDTMDISVKAAFLVSCIDGAVSLGDIIDIAGLPAGETADILVELILDEYIQLAPIDVD